MDRLELTHNYDRVMEVGKWMEEIPYLKFKSTWEVQVIPPFGGATVRFRIKKGKAAISVYLDCYNRHGVEPTPYWEVWNGNEEFRCRIDESEKLMSYITLSLEGRNLVVSFILAMFVFAKQTLFNIPQA